LDFVAWSLLKTAQMWGGAEELTANDFHPIRLTEKIVRDEQLASQVKDVLATLPETMSNADIEEQWRAIKSSDVFPKG